MSEIDNQKHTFKAGDKVVIKPGDPADHLANKILTVDEVFPWSMAPARARLRFKEVHSQAGYFATRFEPFEYKFKAGDKVITRPHDHPGHRKCNGGKCNGDANLVAYLDNQILTIESVKTGTVAGFGDLVTIEKDRPSSHWGSRFMPMPDGFIPKPCTIDVKVQEAPNQVYIDHICERLVQRVTPSELLGLGEKLIKIGNEG